MTARRDPNDTGGMGYPRLPVPARRKSDPQRPGRRADRGLILVVAASVAASGVGAWFLRPVLAPDARIVAANQRASDAAEAAARQKDRADALEKARDAEAKVRRDAEAKLAASDAAQPGGKPDGAAQRKAAELVQGKLKAAVDRTTGAITLDGAEVHLQISDRVLFKPGDDALSDRGKAVLGKVGAALKDLPDQRVWIQGHTDDQPVALGRAAVTQAAAKKGRKPAGAPAARTTSWELSAARALSVVHYLQDVARLESVRLVVLVFGHYVPISKKDRSVNRRIEIVVAAISLAN